MSSKQNSQAKPEPASVEEAVTAAAEAALNDHIEKVASATAKKVFKAHHDGPERGYKPREERVYISSFPKDEAKKAATDGVNEALKKHFPDGLPEQKPAESAGFLSLFLGTALIIGGGILTAKAASHYGNHWFPDNKGNQPLLK